MKQVNRKVEGTATVIRLGSWMSATGPQWESPSVTFAIAGEDLTWRASDEHAVRDLMEGEEVWIRGFVNAEGRITRVKFWRGQPVEDGPSDEQKAALAKFAAANGRTWKQALGHCWMTGIYSRSDDAGYLQQVRNQFGPSWLMRYKLTS